MVKLFLLFSSLLFADISGIRVEMELSKQEFFQGEQVLAQFFVVGDVPQAEVEVVKFPEFKGYWSENQALRQGPLPMMPVFAEKPKKQIWGQPSFQGIPVKYKGLIGAYTLSPMMIKKEWTIEPMKVLIRGAGETADRVVTHEIPKHTILPLPPLPSVFQSNLFFGAVGTFSIEMIEPEIGFRDGEASGIRMSLTGQGNFADLDTIPLSLPAIVEPVSKRSFTQTHAGSGQKSFEWDVIVHSDQNFSIEESGFYFFNPHSKRYEFAKIPKLTFSKLAPLPVLAPETSLQTREIEAEWSSQWDLENNIFFWILQAIALITLVATHLPKRQRKAKTSAKDVLKHLAHTSPKEIYDISIDLLENKLERRLKHLTHKEIIKSLSTELAPLAHDLLPIIESYQRAEYSRDKSNPTDASVIREHFKSLLNKAA